MIALIDADPIKYSCGFSIQKRDPETEILHVEPVKHAYYNCNSIIKKILNRTEATDHKVFLTGSSPPNFRYDYFKYYKENRVKCEELCEHPFDCDHDKHTHKPIYFKEIHEFIKKRWSAVVTEGEEADDAISILQWCSWKEDTSDNQTIICSIDKDFDTVPGWHYNWNKDKVYWVEPLDALRFFYLQLLTGDNSDNIPRIKKGWLKKDYESKLLELTNEIDMIQLVKAEIKKIYPEFTTDQINERINFQGILVKLRSYDGELWSLPNEDDN